MADVVRSLDYRRAESCVTMRQVDPDAKFQGSDIGSCPRTSPSSGDNSTDQPEDEYEADSEDLSFTEQDPDKLTLPRPELPTNETSLEDHSHPNYQKLAPYSHGAPYDLEVCEACGADLDLDGYYCIQCRAPADFTDADPDDGGSEEELEVCKACGADLDLDGYYCVRCRAPADYADANEDEDEKYEDATLSGGSMAQSKDEDGPGTIIAEHDPNSWTLPRPPPPMNEFVREDYS
ncbi:hypothetical protein FRC01_004590 [Tulasnella sp. 417]|nr:hypothetical protein FRC01_004590 [Tulasnella sp. 417]